MALPCVNHGPCILSYESLSDPSSMKCRWQQIKPRQPQQILPYTIPRVRVANVSLGLAHGMEGMRHVVTAARDNRKASEVWLNGPALRWIHESES
jgi:hypothetical protein